MNYDCTAHLFGLMTERFPRRARVSTTEEARVLLDAAAAAELDQHAIRRVATLTSAAATWIAADEPVHAIRKLAQALAVFGGDTRRRAEELADEAHTVLKDLGSLPR